MLGMGCVSAAADAQTDDQNISSHEQLERQPNKLDGVDGLFIPNNLNLEFSGQFLVEAWDLNLAKETLLGGTVALGYSLSDRIQLNTELALLRVRQDTSHDVLVPIISPIVRWRSHTHGPVSVFWEIGPGISYATNEVPVGGTRFNYVFQVGSGMSYTFSSGVNLVGGLRWLHLSNNSLNGRDKNPDIQAVGIYVGWVVG
jgi:hypothetical protein